MDNPTLSLETWEWNAHRAEIICSQTTTSRCGSSHFIRIVGHAFWPMKNELQIGGVNQIAVDIPNVVGWAHYPRIWIVLDIYDSLVDGKTHDKLTGLDHLI